MSNVYKLKAICIERPGPKEGAGREIGRRPVWEVAGLVSLASGLNSSNSGVFGTEEWGIPIVDSHLIGNSTVV